MKKPISVAVLCLASLTLRAQSVGEAVRMSDAAVRLDGGDEATQAGFTILGNCSGSVGLPTYFTLFGCPQTLGAGTPTDGFVLTLSGGVATWLAAAGGGAPTSAQYVTLAVDGTLSAERTLAGGLGLSLTDGGANGAATLALDLSELTTDSTETAGSDFIPYRDVGEGADNKILISDLLAHPVLDSTVHTDTLTGTVVRGDIVRGNSTPAWSRLAKGTAGQFLGSDGTDVFWHDLSNLTTDATPDPTIDYMMSYDATATQNKKVLINNILGVRTLTGGVGIAALGDLSADRTVTLDLNELTTDSTPSVTADFIPYRDTGEGADNKILIQDLPFPRVVLHQAGSPLSSVGPSSTVETDLVGTNGVGFVIPNNTLATAGQYRITIIGRYINNSGSTEIMTFRSYFEGTEGWESATGALATSASSKPFLAMVYLSAAGTDSSQRIAGWVQIGSGAAGTGYGLFSSAATMTFASFSTANTTPLAVDTTTGTNEFRFTMQWTTSHASLQLDVHNVLIEYIP